MVNDKKGSKNNVRESKTNSRNLLRLRSSKSKQTITDLFSPNRNTETTRNQNPQHEQSDVSADVRIAFLMQIQGGKANDNYH